ncbi:MAG TPA: thioredoxin [Pyrodictium sp.]|nr:thioredoxin [Pyrodictium sp.]
MAETQLQVVKRLEDLITKIVDHIEKTYRTALIQLDSNSFDNFIKNAPIAIVLFAAHWCKPCTALLPIYEKIALRLSNRRDVRFGIIDVDRDPAIADRYGINDIPAILVYVHGNVVDAIIGLHKVDDIEKRLEKIVNTYSESR